MKNTLQKMQRGGLKGLTRHTFADIVEARVAHLGAEMLKRAPNFFDKDRLTRFLHAFSKLESMFPELDWDKVSVRQLIRAAEQALQALPKKEE